MKKDLALFAKQLELLAELQIRYSADPILRFRCKPIPLSQISSIEIQNFAQKFILRKVN